MLLILGFDVDHLLAANIIDDEHSDDEHWFSDESMYIYIYIYVLEQSEIFAATN
jgi:hypothetical protein